MRCSFCGAGVTSPGTVTVTLDRDLTTVIVRDVPAEVCDVCGEYYLDEPVSSLLLERAESAVTLGVEVEIMRWPAA